MEHDLRNIIIFFAFFFCTMSVVVCKITSDTFKYKPEFGGKTCALGDQLFTVTALRRIVCVNKCSQTPGCLAVAYSVVDFICTGCDGLHLVNQPGTFFYIVDCGPPTSSDAHVVLDTINGNTVYGSHVSYTCTPCTFFPRTTPAVITCQADATWSAPDCVYGPDVGRLSNGNLIPIGSIGCVIRFGNTCPGDKTIGFRYNGQYGECYCDHRCCRKQDCCFDSTCSEGNHNR